MGEITLSWGVRVRCVPVPPLVSVAYLAELETRDPSLRLPDPPMVRVEGVAGAEEAPVLPGSDEYRAWKYHYDLVEARRNNLLNDALWDLAVEAWQEPGGEWQTEPPEDWDLPPRYRAYIGAGSSRRAEYIKYHLIRAAEDIRAIQAEAIGSVVVSPEEVTAIADTFPGEGEWDAA